ncbi:hypothetical protein N0M98_18715 [Paenibacillus doosanensis]|uniref:Uncharacterized protein n=1 Tax=Paenibacillus konkukensis TaxID=2020716 RepID=A0ABY4RN27_9BACL|nr:MULTISPECIES: hypothetical protein [Paenibacillus]MCS7462175.1 hypothetical protein [Paenibacillus doosanensis]UQZ82963.1 hypothetical protein SK3146_02123 [Paenibacillus konkukensis]
MDGMLETIDQIPWRRLTTAYGRGTDIPRLIRNRQYKELAGLIEHQSTLWQATPWALLMLLRELAGRKPEEVDADEIELYLSVTSAFAGRNLGAEQPPGTMGSLLDEACLWPVDEEEDELLWEDEEPRGYDPDHFFGYYYFSYALLKRAEPMFASIKDNNARLAPAVQELLQLLAEEEG